MKTDYIRGFKEKCADYNLDSSDLLKEAGKMDALKNIVGAIQDSYQGSALQDVIGDMGKSTSDLASTVANSNVVSSMGNAAGAVKEDSITRVKQLADMLKSLIG